ncbi:family 16 glycosylhydrolase [Leifsonia sp. NPDC056824]|uniref:family 16 glycosylhydrolase n=1 Tax=Leifsonia sp. NPDC056824 TaxID=3345953 RepID=UPI00368CB48F
MNLTETLHPLRGATFRAWRAAIALVPGGRIRAFGRGPGRIEAILVINLDRQPTRWRRVARELRRFKTVDGDNLMSIVRRFAAIDARDGRAVAATADVDPLYQIGDQLFVQPDDRLAQSFQADEPVRMSRQEIAVARSHIEVWKSIAIGAESHVLVLEDDAWFRPAAGSSIDRIWREAGTRKAKADGPDLVYLSYEDAGGTALREDEHGGVFRPIRGLWHLSGYVLSRAGAKKLLRSMPVEGPVDLWMNYRLAELDALAMTSPAIGQRLDGESDNAYSVMPYLARAGVVDGGHAVMPGGLLGSERVLAWTRRGDREGLAMALSMLGLRVRVFDIGEELLSDADLVKELRVFDALVDPPLKSSALESAMAIESTKFVFEGQDGGPAQTVRKDVSASRIATVSPEGDEEAAWQALCELLKIPSPVEPFPLGAPSSFQLFRHDRSPDHSADGRQQLGSVLPMDDSPWVLPPGALWRRRYRGELPSHAAETVIVAAPMTDVSESFPSMTETFPGNLASFSPDNLLYGDGGVRVVLERRDGASRPFVSGALASERTFLHGRFQADIRAAAGPGVITGFFLHRGSPRQEIDIEIAGSDPTRMLTNVYFNPGDEGSAFDYGYRGAPHRVDLGFDATQEFHEYAIVWTEDGIVWLVDGIPVHERTSWNPTPIPHLTMRLHANLWAPRSLELAGQINNHDLPTSAEFRNVVVSSTRSGSCPIHGQRSRPDQLCDVGCLL